MYGLVSVLLREGSSGGFCGFCFSNVTQDRKRKFSPIGLEDKIRLSEIDLVRWMQA
jgi:hypothetical protein